MIAALICVISFCALLQFGFSSSRSVVAASRELALSDQVRRCLLYTSLARPGPADLQCSSTRQNQRHDFVARGSSPPPAKLGEPRRLQPRG